MCYECIFPKYTVAAGFIEPAQLKTLKLVPYRKYLGNTVSRVSKLATFFMMVNSQSAESLLSGLHTNCPISTTSHHMFLQLLNINSQLDPSFGSTVIAQWYICSAQKYKDRVFGPWQQPKVIFFEFPGLCNIYQAVFP